GHWNVVLALQSLPAANDRPGSDAPRWYEGQRYRHFQTATARTLFVLGEFPWQGRVGETVTAADYVAPPRILSAQIDAEKEVTWSLGEYISGAHLWTSFSLAGAPPPAKGVFANQPSPFTMTGRLWRQTAVLTALAALVWLAHMITAQGKSAFTQQYAF